MVMGTGKLTRSRVLGQLLGLLLGLDRAVTHPQAQAQAQAGHTCPLSRNRSLNLTCRRSLKRNHAVPRSLSSAHQSAATAAELVPAEAVVRLRLRIVVVPFQGPFPSRSPCLAVQQVVAAR